MIDWAKERNHFRLVGFVLTILAFIAFAALFFILRPWFGAAVTPVEVSLGADVETTIYLGYAEDEPPVKLVPVDTDKAFSWTWVTELPARPDYHLRLMFSEDHTSVQLAELSLIQLVPERQSVPLPLDGLMLMDRKGCSIKQLNNEAFLIIGSEGAWIELAKPMDALVTFGFFEYLRYGITYWLYAIVGIGLILFGLKFPETIELRKGRRRRWEHALAWGLFGLGAVCHLILVIRSMPAFWPADSTSYTMKAVQLADAFSFDTGTQEYELNRLPGYPLFMAVAFELLGWQLESVMRLQALFFVAALGCLLWSVRNWTRGWMLGPAAFLYPSQLSRLLFLQFV